MQGQFDSVICHTALRKVIGTDLLGTVSRTYLASSCFRFFIMTFLQLHIIQTGAQNTQCLISVFEL